MSGSEISRRRLLGLGAAAAGGAALGATSMRGIEAVSQAALPGQAVEFYGARQAGVATAQQAHAVVAVYGLAAPKRGEFQDLLRTLTKTAHELTRGAAEPQRSNGDRPADNGMLGSGFDTSRLTVTVALGSNIFALVGDPLGIATRKPAHLKPMPEFPGDALIDTQTGGDLLIQICADDSQVALHALRTLEQATRGALVPRAVHRGQHRFATNNGETKARGLLGFKDGTANINQTDTQTLDMQVWLPARAADEPAWTQNGTYMVFRKIRERLEAWDRESLDSQQRLIGRQRTSGAPLDGKQESDQPNFRADPDGQRTPLDSHIRRANPRLPGKPQEQILRRSYPYFDGHDSAGLIDAGLLFFAFQRDPIAQFETIKQRISPRGARPQGLDEYLQPVGGGYFFVPHGASGQRDYIASHLFA